MREQEHLERERVRLLSRRVVVKLVGLTDQTQPAEIAADAHQLIETDRVLGMAGNSDISSARSIMPTGRSSACT